MSFIIHASHVASLFTQKPGQENQNRNGKLYVTFGHEKTSLHSNNTLDTEIHLDNSD